MAVTPITLSNAAMWPRPCSLQNGVGAMSIYATAASGSKTFGPIEAGRKEAAGKYRNDMPCGRRKLLCVIDLYAIGTYIL
jgi:hypothetical protein